MELLAFILSSLATVCISIPSFLKGKNMKLILLLVCATNALMASSYILTGAYNGAVSSGIGAVQTIINYFFYERKSKPIPRWLIGIYAGAFLVVNLLVFSQLADILALVATMAFILSICQPNGKLYRTWTCVNASSWVIYDIATRSYGPVLTHSILFITTVAGMLLHDRKKK